MKKSELFERVNNWRNTLPNDERKFRDMSQWAKSFDPTLASYLEQTADIFRKTYEHIEGKLER